MPKPSKQVKKLLAELEPLPYPERVQTVATRSQALAAGGELAAVTTELRGGDPYQRQLALTMAAVTAPAVPAQRDVVVAAATGDPEPGLRASALKTCLRAGWLSTGALVELVGELPADARRAVYRWLRAMRGGEYADALVDVVRTRFGDVEAARLLAACGSATVDRLLPALAHAVAGWPALGRRHPDPVLDYAAGALAGLPPPARADWWRRCGSGVLAAAADRPDRALDLLERFAPASYLPGSLVAYGVLAAADPDRLLGLLTAPARAPWLLRTRLPAALLRRFGRLDPTRLHPLGRRLREHEGMLGQLLHAMPPGRRGPFYDAIMADVDTGQQVPSSLLLDALPGRWQQREARRILALDRIRDDEATTRRFTAYLPWDEAAPVLTAATRRAEPNERAAGYRLLVAAAGRSRDPAVVAEVVAQLTRLRNEQDPVRVQALRALAQVAPLLRADSAPVLAEVVTDAYQARDASIATLSALSDLAVSVLRHHHHDPVLLGWALETCERLFQGHHLPPLGRLDTVLRRGQERQLFAAVRPWLAAGMARGRFEPLFRVARALGRRAWRLAELQGLLRRALDAGAVSAVFRTAAELRLADPATRGQRVAEVLRVDSSAVTLPVVWRTLCTRRTDLLDIVLTGRGPAGRFLTAGVRWVPGYAIHPHRWLPRQQRAYADLQARVAADAGATIRARVAALGATARVPGSGSSVLARYVDSANPNLAEAALAGLPWTDRPADVLPALLDHANGEHARVAVYAAARAARFVPPAELTARLADIATGSGKVTSRKEAIRLLVRLGGPPAMELVVAAWRQAGQHRDVRATIAAAAARRLDLASSWQIIEEAAGGSREEVAAVLAVSPAIVAEPDRPRYARLVAAACGSADRQMVRAAWASLPGWAPWWPDLVGPVVAAMSDLDDHHTWPAVATAAGGLLDGADGASVLAAALAVLLRLDAVDDDPGGPARDRPAHRRITALVNQAANWADRAGPDADRASVREAARALARHPDFVPPAARLLTHLVQLDRESVTAELTEVAELTADRPVLAFKLTRILTRRLRGRGATWQPSAVRAAAAALADRGDPSSGLLAVALAGGGAGDGWTEPWRELVHRLRRHPAADVRSAAYDLSMAAR